MQSSTLQQKSCLLNRKVREARARGRMPDASHSHRWHIVEHRPEPIRTPTPNVQLLLLKQQITAPRTMASSPSDTLPNSLNGEENNNKKKMMMKNELLSQLSQQPLPSQQQPPTTITQQPPPQPSVRQQRRNSRSLTLQSSLKILPENMPIDEKESVHERRSSIGSLTSSINSCNVDDGDTTNIVVERRGSYNNNNRLPPRRSKRFSTANISVPQSAATAEQSERNTSSTNYSAVNNTIKTTSDRRESWQCNTDWEDVSYSGVYDSIASQSSLYHVLGEEEEEEDVEEDQNDGRIYDDNSEEEKDKVSLSDIDINNERSDSNFSCGGSSSSIPKRGVSRQLSAKSFRRSIQDTLKYDEDSSIFGVGCSSRTSSLMASGDSRLLFGDDDSSEQSGSSILGGSDRIGIDRFK